MPVVTFKIVATNCLFTYNSKLSVVDWARWCTIGYTQGCYGFGTKASILGCFKASSYVNNGPTVYTPRPIFYFSTYTMKTIYIDS